jgi:hypothetical protein
MPGSVLTVYLDQKDWIALLKAREERPDGTPFAAALTVLEAAVTAGKVSLPLSHVHYQETSHRKPFSRRVQLASLMAELSQFHTIAPFFRLAKDEMRYFIAAHSRQFDNSATVRAFAPPQPFGRGGDHAFGDSSIGDSLDGLKKHLRTAETGVDHVVDGLSEKFELALIAGDPEHDKGPAPADELRQLQATEAGRREARRQVRLQHGGTKGELSHRTKFATAFYERQEEILEALADVGVRRMPGNDVAITWFVEGVSTLYCDYELSRLKEEATNQPWTENDVRDVWALCAATVYADVVVTEKSWARLINRELAQRFDTLVLDNVADLVDPLIAAAA